MIDVRVYKNAKYAKLLLGDFMHQNVMAAIYFPINNNKLLNYFFSF